MPTVDAPLRYLSEIIDNPDHGRLERVESGDDEGRLTRACCCDSVCKFIELEPVGFCTEHGFGGGYCYENTNLIGDRRRCDGVGACSHELTNRIWSVNLSSIDLGGSRLLDNPAAHCYSPWPVGTAGYFTLDYVVGAELAGVGWSDVYGWCVDWTSAAHPLDPLASYTFQMFADLPDLLWITTDAYTFAGGAVGWNEYWEAIVVTCLA